MITGMILYEFYRIFVKDWHPRFAHLFRVKHQSHYFSLPTLKSLFIVRHINVMSIFKCMSRNLMLLAFFAVNLGLYVAYVLVIPVVTKTELVFIQILLQLVNAFSRSVTPLIVSSIYCDDSGGNMKVHDPNKVLLTTLLTSFVEVALPLVATLLSDDLCFQSLIYGEEPIQFTYSYPSCAAFAPFSNGCQVYETLWASVSKSFL